MAEGQTAWFAGLAEVLAHCGSALAEELTLRVGGASSPAVRHLRKRGLAEQQRHTAFYLKERNDSGLLICAKLVKQLSENYPNIVFTILHYIHSPISPPTRDFYFELFLSKPVVITGGTKN